MKIHKRDADQKVGLDLGYSQDGRWLVVAAVQPGTLAAVFSELKPGAKLVDVMANGETNRQPSLQEAVALIGGCTGNLELTIMPLLDRYGFIVTNKEFLDNPVTRDMIRY